MVHFPEITGGRKNRAGKDATVDDEEEEDRRRWKEKNRWTKAQRSLSHLDEGTDSPSMQVVRKCPNYESRERLRAVNETRQRKKEFN